MIPRRPAKCKEAGRDFSPTPHRRAGTMRGTSQRLVRPNQGVLLMNSLRSLLALASLLLPGVVGAAEPKPIEVQVVRPVMKQVAEHASFTGRVDAFQRVEVRAKITAYLVKIAFQEGAFVKQGDVLFE